MHTVIVKYQLPAAKPRDAMLAAFRAAEGQFAGLPGLVRKYFCYDEAAHCGHSVYLWETKEQAEAFFGPEFSAAMQEKFGATPEVFGVDTLLVVDGPAA
jgi:hypothetical protein